MSLNDALDAGLQNVPGCRAVCYVDMKSGLVLATRSIKPYPQEVLDSFASITTQLVNSPVLAAMRNPVSNAGTSGGDGKDVCVVFGQTGLNVFIRAPKFPDHALCYICNETMRPEDVLAKVKQNQDDVAGAF